MYCWKKGFVQKSKLDKCHAPGFPEKAEEGWRISLFLAPGFPSDPSGVKRDQPHIPLMRSVTARSLFISYLFEQSCVLTIFIDLFK